MEMFFPEFFFISCIFCSSQKKIGDELRKGGKKKRPFSCYVDDAHRLAAKPFSFDFTRSSSSSSTERNCFSLSTHTQFEEAAGNKNGQKKKKNKKDQKLVVSGSQTQRHFE
jgi:hypothetical protein